MANNFSDIAVRGYTLTDPSWWNSLRSAGIILQNLLGAASGSIAETAFTFANNQSTADVTGLLFDKTVGKHAEVTVSVRRYTTTLRAICTAKLFLTFDETAAVWLLDYAEYGDPSGITWSITSAGQVRYATDNMSSGTGYSGASRFRAQGMGL